MTIPNANGSFGGNLKKPFEDGIALEQFESDEALMLLSYPVYFDWLDRPVPADQNGVLQALVQEGLILRDIGGRWDIRNLGAILLAKDLDKFPALRRKAVRVIQYSGTDRMNALKEKVFRKGYAAGFEHVIDYIGALPPTREVVGKALRRTIVAYPDIAVRELVANMLIHQDFSMTGTGPMVEVLADRLEITNPGEPLVSTNRFIDAPLRSRNEAMASLMRRFGIGEDRGIGIDRVIDAVERLRLPAPLFESPPGGTRSVMFASRNLQDLGKSDRLRAVYWHACLSYVTKQKMTSATLRERFGVKRPNSAIISRWLKDAVEAGQIVLEDPSTGGRGYSYLPFWASPAPSDVGQDV